LSNTDIQTTTVVTHRCWHKILKHIWSKTFHLKMSYMKKQLFSLSAIVAMVIMASCNNGSNTNSSTTDTTNTTTTTTTMDTGTGTNRMNSDTGMNNNRMDTSTTGRMGTTGTSANNVSASDKKFINEAAIGGMMEVQAGQLAATNATNDRVKAFGNMMVQDHTNANNQLKALASSKNVTIPDSMDAKHRAHVDMLRKKTGKDFDKAYMNMMVMDHNEDVSKFQMESKHATDADVKSFAATTLPVLQKHLDSAKAINHSKL
jgi:putative membrane protein